MEMSRQGSASMPIIQSEPLSDLNDTIIQKIKQQAKSNEQGMTSYHRMLNVINHRYHQQPTIFKLEGQLHNVITTVAIGPYHHSAATQPIITSIKKSGIVMFLVCVGLDIRSFLDWARGDRVQEKIRLCYEPDSICITSTEELVEMLLLDGCLVLFAIFHLRSSKHEDRRQTYFTCANYEHRNEFLIASEDITLYMKQLKLELLMLDNQIPFFVVDELFGMLKNTLFKGINYGIKEMALSCFDDILPGRSSAKSITELLPDEAHHLLHIFHCSRIPSEKYKVTPAMFLPYEPKAHLPSASELRDYATIFRSSPPGSPLEVSFDCSILRMGFAVISIPAIHISDYSEVIFRNLIAFEQSHLRCSLSVTAYSICMARLLQNEDDAKILRKKRILVHTKKNDKEIVEFFRRLTDQYKDTPFPKDLKKLYKDVSRHHNSRLAEFCGGIKRNYCANPWIVISAIAAVILFLVTVGNNTHSMYRYYHPIRH